MVDLAQRRVTVAGHEVKLTPTEYDILKTLAQHAAAAQQALPASAWAYFQGGAADEHTLQANTAAWSEWRLLPRVLQPLTLPDTAVTLCGRRWPTPWRAPSSA